VVGPESPLADAPQVPVPRTNRNPIQSLRPEPVTFLIGKREFEIPALPAVDWLQVLMRPDWIGDDLFLELMPEGLQILDLIDPEQSEDLATDIIEEVTGRHWWVALRLVGFLIETWEVMGPEATFHNVDAERLSLAAWMDAMLVLLLARVSKDQAPGFVARLESPPYGEQIPEEELAISEGQFLSMGG
jgi:hypothetical protein